MQLRDTSDLPSPIPDDRDAIIVRNRGSAAGARAAVALIGGLMVAVDPLGLWVTWRGPGQGFHIDMIGVVAWFAALSALLVVVVATPRVIVTRTSITVVNPLRRIEAPLASVAGFEGWDRDYPWLATTDGRRFRVAAAEKIGARLSSVHERLSARMSDSGLADGDRAPVVVRRWRGTVSEWPVRVVFGGWMAYVVAAWFVGRA